MNYLNQQSKAQWHSLCSDIKHKKNEILINVPDFSYTVSNRLYNRQYQHCALQRFPPLGVMQAATSPAHCACQSVLPRAALHWQDPASYCASMCPLAMSHILRWSKVSHRASGCLPDWFQHSICHQIYPQIDWHCHGTNSRESVACGQLISLPFSLCSFLSFSSCLRGDKRRHVLTCDKQICD